LEIRMIADKAVYTPGETITYKIWSDVSAESGAAVDHCAQATFVIDPNIEIKSLNFVPPGGVSGDHCDIIGNSILCDGSIDRILWFMGTSYHDFLKSYDGPANTRGSDFSITGQIKPGTPLGTTLTSTATLVSYLDTLDPITGTVYSIADDSTNQVTVGGNPSPEFPSALLPVTFIVGIIGAVLLIQRTREH
jgi:hypothetical protein